MHFVLKCVSKNGRMEFKMKNVESIVQGVLIVIGLCSMGGVFQLLPMILK